MTREGKCNNTLKPDIPELSTSKAENNSDHVPRKSCSKMKSSFQEFRELVTTSKLEEIS